MPWTTYLVATFQAIMMEAWKVMECGVHENVETKIVETRKEQERRLLQGDGAGSLRRPEVKQSWWKKKQKV